MHRNCKNSKSKNFLSNLKRTNKLKYSKSCFLKLKNKSKRDSCNSIWSSSVSRSVLISNVWSKNANIFSSYKKSKN